MDPYGVTGRRKELRTALGGTPDSCSLLENAWKPEIRDRVTLLPRLKCSGSIIAHWRLKLCSSDPFTLSSQDSRHVPPYPTNFILFYLEMESPYAARDGPKLLAPSDPPASVSQNREIPGGEATRVTSVTLLAGEALLPAPGAALPSAEYTGRTVLAGPIPTRKTAIGSAED
ncbi:LOW QUALITY PROTEIN: hypothetical protein AAY473_031886 [Plecturocebus cupreus]